MSSGSAVGTLNIAGNFSHTGGTITETGTGSGSILFNGSNNQFYTSGGTISNTISFSVNSNSKLQISSPATIVSGSGSFNLSSGATLGITSASGISVTGATGNIQVTGTRTFNASANYVYNGTSAQVLRNGFPTDLTGTLTIDNAEISLDLTMPALFRTGFNKSIFRYLCPLVQIFPWQQHPRSTELKAVSREHCKVCGI